MTSIHDHIWRAAAERPSHIALVEGDREVTYAGLRAKVAGAANWIRGEASPGDRVGLILGNSIGAVVWLYGVTAAGAIAVPIDADAPPAAVRRALVDSGASLLLTTAGACSRLGPLPADGPRAIVADDIELAGVGQGEGDLPEDAGRAHGRPACILHTTGTTATPKLVTLTHANLVAATANTNAFMRPGPWIVESIPMRLSHSFGFGRLRAVLAVGGTAVLEQGLVRVGALFERMRRRGVNAFASVPAGFALLLGRYLEPFRSVGTRLRLVEIGSAPMARRQKELLAACCPRARIAMHYGLTEASRAAFLDFEADRGHLDTAGRPAPNVEMRIVTDAGTEATAGEAGEVQVKGAIVTTGFWGRPDLTRDALADGWLRTGDLGWMDTGGYLHLAGRLGEIINLGGFKVAPVEVEECLRQFDGVEDAAVTTAPGDVDGAPVLKALLVAKGAPPSPDPERLRAFCYERLAPYKVPAVFETVASLPRTASGKLLRGELRGTGGPQP